MRIKFIVPVGVLSLVVACGGGGGGVSSAPQNGVAFSERPTSEETLVTNNLPIVTFGEAVFNIASFQIEEENQYFDNTIFQ